jgi:hypothetical protein
MARSRRAGPRDIGELALALPETAEAIVWGDRPAYTVKGRSFVIYRDARPDALDADGQRMTDVVVFSCSSPEEKDGLLASGGPWSRRRTSTGTARSWSGCRSSVKSPVTSLRKWWKTLGWPAHRSGWPGSGSRAEVSARFLSGAQTRGD